YQHHARDRAIESHGVEDASHVEIDGKARDRLWQQERQQDCAAPGQPTPRQRITSGHRQNQASRHRENRDQDAGGQRFDRVAPRLIMIGTDSTESMVTKERISPTTIAELTCGSTISIRMRSRRAPRLRAASIVARSSEAIAPATSSATKGVCFHTNVTMMPRQ